MIKKYLLALAVLLIPVVAVVAAPPVSAQLFEESKQQACSGANLDENVQLSECEDQSKGAGQIEETIENIVNILTVIVGIAAVILIIINGFRLITSNGDAAAITSARNGIIYAIVGLIIVAFAQVIVRFVLNRTVS